LQKSFRVSTLLYWTCSVVYFVLGQSKRKQSSFKSPCFSSTSIISHRMFYSKKCISCSYFWSSCS